MSQQPTVGGLTAPSLVQRMTEVGLTVDFGAARVRIFTDCEPLASAILSVYQHFPDEQHSGFVDATVQVLRVRGLRRFINPQIEFLSDANRPFEPFPADTTLPLLEWGMNYALSDRIFHYLVLHAGVVAKNNRAVLFPAIPGSGKSTLTAALHLSGYRLLSDEFGVIEPESGHLIPMVRPVALKNNSVPIIRDRFPSAVLGPIFPKTKKGEVSHLAPSLDSVRARHTVAVPAMVVFPRYAKGVRCRLEDVDAASAFNRLAVNSFNYEFLGPKGFRRVTDLVRKCPCKQLIFDSLDDAIATIDDLLESIEGSKGSWEAVTDAA